MPIRTCFVTGQKLEKTVLLRFVVVDGKVVFDPQQSAPGRGGYLVESEANLQKLKKMGGKICHFLKVKNVKMDFQKREP
jgi:predicted RNA-binding protein YlxR (DUF448 family)